MKSMSAVLIKESEKLEGLLGGLGDIIHEGEIAKNFSEAKEVLVKLQKEFSRALDEITAILPPRPEE